MAITPNSFSIAVGGTVELTSTINNAFWSVVSGGANLSAGSTSYKKVVTGTAAGSVTVKAQGSVWNNYAPLTRDASDNLVKTDQNNYYFIDSNVFLKNVGDFVEMPMWSGFTTSSRMVVMGATQVFGQVDHVYAQDRTEAIVANVPTTIGSIIRWEIITGGQLRLSQNGTTLYTFTSIPSVYNANGYLFRLLVFAEPTGTVLTKPAYSSTTSNVASETVTGLIYAPLSIDTTSPLPNLTVGNSATNTIITSGGSGSISFSYTGTLPAGRSLSSGGVMTGTATAAGTFTFTITATDSAGGTASKTFTQTVSEAAPPPISKWTGFGFVPKNGLELWNMLDASADGATAYDFSGNGRDLTASSSAPSLQTIPAINNQRAAYFSGSGNPLKYTGNFTLKHFFIVAAFEPAQFTEYSGLLTGAAFSGNDILVGNPASANFLNFGYTNFQYRRSDVPLAPSGQKASTAAVFAVIEGVLPVGFAMDGITVGQQRGQANTKWRGWFSEMLGWSRVLTGCERMDVYRHLAMKYNLWRQMADGINIFPFANDKKISAAPSKVILESQSISGAYKARTKSGLIRSFDAGYTGRRQEEFEAAEVFADQHFPGRRLIFEDNSVYPPRQYSARMTQMPVRDSDNYFHDYKVGFKTV